ncbi:hypothetical protein [Campylobacter sp. 19-13652]|uniref:hypothetical protein n=1 Tax=Campylobacter sp. 19-13652 TaxID=2840180 RepID=UPI001C7915D7|nr:hypothetical protein [Campylobacter sp. 19-13652]BCX78684.1 hypothetical protein LBC_01460 [Campylobacter sp. 19-13652]
MCKFFNLYSLMASLLVGIGCWFLVDYIDPLSLYSFPLEMVKIFAMLAVFLCCIFAILSIVGIFIKAVFKPKCTIG